MDVVWTFADLAGRPSPGRVEMDTALSFRLATTIDAGAV